jgi:hypothetical protein
VPAQFAPHGVSWSAPFFEARDYAEYSDMCMRRMALLEAPNARYDSRQTIPANALSEANAKL